MALTYVSTSETRLHPGASLKAEDCRRETKCLFWADMLRTQGVVNSSELLQRQSPVRRDGAELPPKPSALVSLDGMKEATRGLLRDQPWQPFSTHGGVHLSGSSGSDARMSGILGTAFAGTGTLVIIFVSAGENGEEAMERGKSDSRQMRNVAWELESDAASGASGGLGAVSACHPVIGCAASASCILCRCVATLQLSSFLLKLYEINV